MLQVVKASRVLTFRNHILLGYVKCAAESQTNRNNVRYFSGRFDMQAWTETLDEAQQKRVRFIQNEVTLQRLENKQAPKIEDLTQSDFQYILGLSQTQRHKYYKFLYKSQNSDAAEKLKGEIRRRVNEEKVKLRKPEEKLNEKNHIEYGLGKGALIPKIYNRTIDKWKNNRTLWRALMNDSNLIYDCGYSNDMTVRENWEAAKQLSHCFGLNRSHRTPFVLHFCNMSMESLLWKNLKKSIPILMERPLPVKIHTQDIIEVFPRDKLVLLTPDSPNILREYDPNMHYVISGLVDRGDKVPHTLAKAKRLDLQTARLPMETYRNCRINKTLTLDQVLQVMLEVKYSGDWNKAFRYVASRKFF